MKKYIVTLLSALVCGASFAQNWAYFPENTLRCYYIDGEESLEGIRFNEYSGHDRVMNLDSFGRLRPLGWDEQHEYFQLFITGNSHFGNRVQKTAQGYKAFFVHDTLKNKTVDSLLFLNPSIHSDWVVMENKHMKITAKVDSVFLGPSFVGTDSLANISLIREHINSTIKDTSHLLLSKSKGPIYIPIPLELLDSRISLVQHINLLPYEEFTNAEFLRIPSGTIHQDKYSIRFYDENIYLRDVIVQKTFFEMNGEQFYEEHEIINDYFEDKSFITTHNKDTFKYTISNPTEIANPIPSKYLFADLNRNYAHENYLYKHTCDGRLLKYSGGPYGGYERDSKDTLKSRLSSTMFDHDIIQNIGTVAEFKGRTDGSITVDFRLSYYKQDSCEWGEPNFRFSSLEKTEIPNFTLYPNPARESLYINNAPTNILTIYAIDQTGKTVPLTMNDNIIDLSNLSNGIHVILITSTTGSFHKKIIVQKR
jgi:hypothetical protein